MSIESTDTKRDVNSNRSFRGRLVSKSFSWYQDVRIERNMAKEVTEKKRATSDVIPSIVNASWFSNLGFPLSSFMPPVMAVEVAKATVAIRAATTEQDSEVLVNHLPPSFTSFLWLWVKISYGGFPSLLWRGKK